jgi:hypothetical protein
VKEYIEEFLIVLPKLTKEEADFILEIVNWDEEKRMAFKFAKKIFEEEDEPDEAA